MWFSLACAFLFSLTVSFLLMRIGRQTAFVDVPDGVLKKHGAPTPRIGGVAVAIGLTVGLLVVGYLGDETVLSYYLPFLFFLAFGLLDDAAGLSPFWKFSFEAAGFLFYLLLSKAPAAPLTFFGLFLGLFLINAFNFTDGADGIATAYALPMLFGLFVCFLFSVSVGELLLSLFCAASLLGFLPFNLPRAKLFLGDSGSLSVGFLLSALSLRAADRTPWVLLMFVLPAIDACRVTVLRIKERRKPWRGDRRHLHHLLFDKGVSPTALFFLYLFLSFSLSVGAVFLFFFT